jgi:hypothetical protein
MSRRQERELHARERFRQPLAQLRDVIRRRCMVAHQRDRDVRIGDADRRRVAVGQVHAGAGDADVVDQALDLVGRDDLADQRTDAVAERGGLLDAQSAACTHVQLDLPGVDGGEEVRPQREDQRQRQQHRAEECRREQPRPAQRGREQRRVALAEREEACVDPCPQALRPRCGVHDRLLAEPVARERRHERPRQQERREHREHDRQRERLEQEAGDAAQEEHRQEHHADAQHRHQRRQHDLLRAVHDGLFDRLAHLQVRVDVLDRHRRVVDEDADREGEPRQRHDVDRLPEGGEGDHGRHDRQRDRDEDDERAAPAAEEEQDQQAGQAGGEQALEDHSAHGRLHEHRLVAEQPDVQVFRQRRGDLRDHRLDAVDDVERRRARAALDRREHRPLAVHADDVRLGHEAVADVRDVAGGTPCPQA